MVVNDNSGAGAEVVQNYSGLGEAVGTKCGGGASAGGGDEGNAWKGPVVEYRVVTKMKPGPGVKATQ